MFISGVTVGSISLFNEDIIKEKDLRIGDTVLVERAGDVIPYIVKSFAETRDWEDEVPIKYPHATALFVKVNFLKKKVKLPGDV